MPGVWAGINEVSQTVALESLIRVRVAYIIFPTLCLGASIALMIKYPLTRIRVREIQEQLKSSEARMRHIITAVSAVLYTIKIEMELPGIKGINLTFVWIGDNLKQFGYEPHQIIKRKSKEEQTKLIHVCQHNMQII